MDAAREAFGRKATTFDRDRQDEQDGSGLSCISCTSLLKDVVNVRSREREPWEAAHARETRSRLFACLPDAQSREVARRRLWLGESVDEIGLAMGLAKSRVQEMLNDEILPRLRRTLRRLGIEPTDKKPGTQCTPPTAR